MTNGWNDASIATAAERVVKMLDALGRQSSAEIVQRLINRYRELLPKEQPRSNGGIPCDVEHGPCACGAWH